MQTLISFTKLNLVLLCLFSFLGCSSVATEEPVNGFEQQKAEQALESFRQDERLKPFFEKAEIIAIYPHNIRAAVGVGGAYGYGLVYRGENIIGRSRVYQITFGINFGGEGYRQILFFKTEEAFQRLINDIFPEFAGQAKVTIATVGASGTPSFNEEVALFTQLKGGLLLEASVGGHHYSFKALGAYDEQFNVE